MKLEVTPAGGIRLGVLERSSDSILVVDGMKGFC